jgi:hypothetical protein
VEGDYHFLFYLFYLSFGFDSWNAHSSTEEKRRRAEIERWGFFPSVV